MPRRAVTFLVVLAIALAAGQRPTAVDLRNVLNGYSLTSWGLNDGLPSSEVLAIAQDADGFLWLGTDGGLVRFDGSRFTPWPGVPPQRSVRTLLVTTEGEIWAGLGEDGGVLHYRRATAGHLQLLRQYGPPEGLGYLEPCAPSPSTPTDRSGPATSAGSSDSPAEAGRGGRLQASRTRRSTRCSSTRKVGCWWAHEAACSSPTTADRAAFTADEASPARDEPVPGLSVDGQGAVWRTDGVHGLSGRAGGGRALTTSEVGRGQRLLHDRDGHLWVGTGGQGLWRVSRGADGLLTVEKSTVTTGLLGNGVVSVFEDREGNIWAGTLDGLNRFTRYVATPIQGLGLVSGIEVTPQGLWVMTADSLLLIPPGESPGEPITKHRGEVTAIHADPRGGLWMSTGDRLWRFDGNGQRTGPIDDRRPEECRSHHVGSTRRSVALRRPARSPSARAKPRRRSTGTRGCPPRSPHVDGHRARRNAVARHDRPAPRLGHARWRHAGVQENATASTPASFAPSTRMTRERCGWAGRKG